MAYNHRGAYGHSLSDAAEGGPAVTTNAQDRLSHVHSLAEGCQSGFQQAGASTQLQVDLHTPQVWTLARVLDVVLGLAGWQWRRLHRPARPRIGIFAQGAAYSQAWKRRVQAWQAGSGAGCCTVTVVPGATLPGMLHA